MYGVTNIPTFRAVAANKAEEEEVLSVVNAVGVLLSALPVCALACAMVNVN